jgi:hypothetical protein
MTVSGEKITLGAKGARFVIAYGDDALHSVQHFKIAIQLP